MIKNKLTQWLSYTFMLITFITSSCSKPEIPQLSDMSFIPIPAEITSDEGFFIIGSGTSVLVINGNDEVVRTANYLADHINQATGFPVIVKTVDNLSGKGNIVVNIVNDESIHREGYELKINAANITIAATSAEGLFRASQTFRQMLPCSAERKEKAARIGLPACTIKDYPRFEYRGAMLDVSRHFFGVDVVKQFIDYLAEYKMNYLHLHLSDDQGWRIEIKSWPNLTAHGGKTQVGGGEGGFYTQEQFSEIVQYAKDRFITIVPEIDMPGHTNAALASYPELNENGIAPELYTGMEVGFSTLATRKEITYQFVDDVVCEISRLITGEYFHIGGDESHVTKKDDYIYFINRVQEIVASYRKKSIGWDEIATATMLPGNVAQYWASAKNAQLAVNQGAKLILSPSSRIYLDMKYDSTTVLGLNWAGYIEVDKAYDWNPAQLIPGIDETHILGVEAPLWTETVETLDDIQYLIFPRILGVAEIGWSPEGLRSWETYQGRLAKQAEKLKARNINFYKSPLVQWNCKE